MAANPQDPVFERLVAQAKGGDLDSLDLLIRRTEHSLRSNIDRRLGTRLRASLRRSDVLQNAYLAMLEALPSFQGRTEEQFVAWVTGIIANDIRRQHRWFTAACRRPPSRTSERNALADILLNPTPTPSAEMAHRERDHGVRQALARLEPDHARVIELAMLQSLPHREVAARMGRSEGACRMLLLRARAALAVELEHLAAESE